MSYTFFVDKGIEWFEQTLLNSAPLMTVRKEETRKQNIVCCRLFLELQPPGTLFAMDEFEYDGRPISNRRSPGSLVPLLDPTPFESVPK